MGEPMTHHTPGEGEPSRTDLAAAIDAAATRMSAWLRELPAWSRHPVNASGSVSAHLGPTILSEHDCVLHFARLLHDAGVPWEDMHLELSPGQWMYKPTAKVRPKRIDLAVVERARLAGSPLPVAVGEFRLEAVFEFALASNYWQFGTGSPHALVSKVDGDVAKVGEYLRSGIADRGYVVVVEECDHRLRPSLLEDARAQHGVELLLLRCWS
jgi:hypothetical protein